MEEIKKILKRLYPKIGKKANGLWINYIMLSNKNEKEDFESFLRLLNYKSTGGDYRDKIILPPPEKENLKGEYYMGKVIYPHSFYCNFGLSEGEWIKHILIAGMTGTGKTNLVFHLLKELIKRKKPFIVFDWKRNYRDLKQISPFSRYLEVFTIGRNINPFYFNPLIPPPLTNAEEWIGKIVEIIKHAYFVGHGVEYLLKKAIHELYKKYGVYKGNKVYPTFEEVDKLLKKEYVKGRELLWMASVKRVLASLISPVALGKVVNVREHFKAEDLLNRYIIFETDALTDSDKIFFIEALLLWIYEYRKTQGKREKFNHALIIEEAHHILSKRKERVKGEETIMESIIRMIREFGEAVIIVDQEPSKLSDSVKANTHCKICFCLGNIKDIIDIAGCMDLDKEQTGFISKLKTGEAIVRIKRENCDAPFLVKFPHIKIEKGVISDEILRRFRTLT